MNRTGGFTLVEIMVMMLIVAILAAVAIPLYKGYIKKCKISEAVTVIGAIIASEKLQMQRAPSQGFYSATTQGEFLDKGLDLSDTKYFTYQVTTDGGTPSKSFTITASATELFQSNPDGCTISYTYNQAPDPNGEWLCDGTCITEDMIPSS